MRLKVSDECELRLLEESDAGELYALVEANRPYLAEWLPWAAGQTLEATANFIRKTGPPLSDEATMTTRFYRHGDVLTVLAIVEDPIYLAEPQIMTRSFQLQNAELSPVGPPCVSAYQRRMPGDSVPHYIPEQNPFVDEMTERYGVPRDAALGMPETLYPEYRKKMKPGSARPGACTVNCTTTAPPAQR